MRFLPASVNEFLSAILPPSGRTIEITKRIVKLSTLEVIGKYVLDKAITGCACTDLLISGPIREEVLTNQVRENFTSNDKRESCLIIARSKPMQLLNFARRSQFSVQTSKV